MAAPLVHHVHTLLPNALLVSMASLIALAVLWLLLHPAVRDHAHRGQ